MAYLVLGSIPFGDKEKPPETKITLIDSVRGDVHEVSIRVIGHIQRIPRPAEVQYAAGVLAEQDDVDGRLTRKELNRAAKIVKHAEETVNELKEDLQDKDKRIEELLKEIVALRNRNIDAETTAILATSLELRIVELAETRQFEEYYKAKDAYKRVTGRSWIRDDD